MGETKRIFSIDISNGFEIVSQYMQRSFTEAQQAAIWHIIDHAGQDPVPPEVGPNPATMTDADWVRLGRRLDGRDTDAPVITIDLTHCDSEAEVRKLTAETVDRALRTWRHLQGSEENQRLVTTGGPLPSDMVNQTAEMIKLVAETNARGLAAQPLGGQSRHDTGFDNGRDHPPALSPGEAMDNGTKRLIARQSGFTGDMCSNCQGMNMKRNGSCLSCADCGSTTGCS